MVCIKQLVAATALFLSGALAAPVPEHSLSVTTADVRARNALDINAREFNAASVVNIEARAKKNKKPVNNKPVNNKPVNNKPVNNTPANNTPKTPKAKSSPAPKPSATKTAGASPSSASACARPTKKPRSLERREGPLRPTTNQLDINEDLYVVNAKGKSAVTNLSGCTAVFLWDANNVPSIFHILCGDETKKTERAMEIVNGNEFTTKAYSILANNRSRYNAAKKVIVDYAKGMEAKEPDEKPLALYKVDGSQRDRSDRIRWLTRARTESGSTFVLVDEVENPDYKPNETGGICQ